MAMRKIYAYLFIPALLLGLAACNKVAGPDVAAEDSDTEIVFAAYENIGDPETKAVTETTTANLAAIKVTAMTTKAYVFENTSFSKSGDVFKGGKYWPSTDGSWKFALANTDMAGTYSAPTVSPANANTDIVVGYLASPEYKASSTSGKTAVTLSHIFARFGSITMKEPSGYSVTNLKVTISPKTSGTYSLSGASWTTKGAAGSAVYVVGSAGEGYNLHGNSGSVTQTPDFMLVPDTYTITATYTISKDSYTANKTATASVTFPQGQTTNIGLVGGSTPNIPAPTDIAELQFSITVTAWGTNNQTPAFN